MPGPPPSSTSRRPNNGAQKNSSFTDRLVLPAAGRKGRTPRWPLPKFKAHIPDADPEWLKGHNEAVAKREAQVWKELWRLPQAVAWEQLGYIRAVSRYVRMLVAAEEPAAAVTLLAQVRMMEDTLGLNPKAMLSLRWVVKDETVSAQDRPTRNERVGRARNLRAVDLSA